MKPALSIAGPLPGHAPARVLPFAAYLLLIAVADLLPRLSPELGAGAADLRWLYAVKIGAVLALLWAYRCDYVELARFDVSARLLATGNWHYW